MNATLATTDAEKVAALFAAARDLIRPDVAAGRVIGLPEVRPAALEMVSTVIANRPGLSVSVGRMILHAACIPAASRRRRVLTGLAKWLPNVSASVRDRERWFSAKIVQEISASSAGACSEAEAAGLLALLALACQTEAGVRGVGATNGGSGVSG